MWCSSFYQGPQKLVYLYKGGLLYILLHCALICIMHHFSPATNFVIFFSFCVCVCVCVCVGGGGGGGIRRDISCESSASSQVVLCFLFLTLKAPRTNASENVVCCK